MTPKEEFRYAFMLKCAEAGLNIEETAEKATQLLHLLEQPQEKVAGWLQDATGAASNLGWGGLLTAATLGTGAGYGLAKLQEGDVDVNDYRNQDLIAAYRAAAQQLRERNARRLQIRVPPKARRLFG